ncbi:MAG: aminotransferase class III-fold pyridoxal phosphate-dependent enzyme, partial [Candidatus Methylomirabilis sp.]|nr:aminotransferase class III-fold pyridoxal phosphate-dependent enzyme [Deltaproteobacteria bacterium]
PVGACGGRADVMDKLAPLGGVYQAGTLSGNPLATAAGLATLALLEEPGVFDRAVRAAETLCAGLLEAAKAGGVPLCVQRVGTMFTAFFQEGPVTDFASAKRSDAARFGRFHAAMLDRGVYLPPSQFEAAFASAAHSEGDVARTLEAARAAMRAA